MGNPPHRPFDAAGRSGRMLTPDRLAGVLLAALEPPERATIHRQLEQYIAVKPSPAVWARLLRSLDLDDQRFN